MSSPIVEVITIRESPVAAAIGFGIPLILTSQGPLYSLSVGEGSAKIKWVSKTRGISYIDVQYLAPAAAPSYIDILLGASRASTAGTNLANDATEYKMDFQGQEILVVGTEVQTMADLVSEINNDLPAGYTATHGDGDDYLRIAKDAAPRQALSLTDGVGEPLVASLFGPGQASIDAPVYGGSTVSVARTGSGTSGDPYLITVTLGGDGYGTINTTAAQVQAAVVADTDTNAIVKTLITAPGTGLQEIFASTPLAGPGADRWKVYNGLEDVVSDGYSEGDPEYDMPAAMLAQDTKVTEWIGWVRDPGSDLSDVLNQIENLHPGGYYLLLIEERDAVSIREASAWLEPQTKFGIFCTSDKTLPNNNEGRNHTIIHGTPLDYPDANLVGSIAPQLPGSYTASMLKAPGQTAFDYESSEFAEIEANNYNWIEYQRGNTYHRQGKTTDGGYTDTRIAIDWVVDRIEAEIFSLLLNSNKVPYDASGFSRVAGAVVAALSAAARQGIVAVYANGEDDPADTRDKVYLYQVYQTRRSDISPTDRGERKYPLTAKFTLAGAIHKVQVILNIAGV